MKELLPALIVLAGLVFVMVPFFLWMALGEDAAPHYEHFDPSRHASPPEAAAFIRDNIAGLTSEQFEQVGDLVRVGRVVTTRVVLLQHPHGEAATIVFAYANQGSATVMVEFKATLASGQVFDVDNMTSPAFLRPRPGHETHRFPEVRDPARLYQVFQALLRRRFGAATVRQQDIASDPARFLAVESDRGYQDMVASGYYRYDERTHRFSPTVKGAYLIALKTLWGVKQLRTFALRRRARAVLRELNLDQRDARPIRAVATITPVDEAPAQEASQPRDTALEWVMMIGGLVLVFAGSFAVRRWTGSGTLAIAVIIVLGPLGLWLVMRRSMANRARAAGGDALAIARAHQNANRVMIPFVGLAAILVALTGYGEVRSRRAARLPDLIVPGEFPAAIRAIGQVTGQPVKKLAGRDSLYIVTVRSRWANRFLRAAHDKYAAQKFFLARFDLHFRNDTTPVRILLAPIDDPFEVLRLVGTNETNGRTTADIAEGLRALNREMSFELRNVGDHWVRGAFDTEMPDPDHVVDRLRKLCPIVLTEDFRGDAQDQAKSIRRGRAFVCRWN